MIRSSLMLFAIICTLALPTATFGAEPLATGSSNWDDIEVRLMSVERKGSVLTVKWAAVNSGEQNQKIYFAFLGNDRCYAIDEENGTKYYALTDQEGNAIASGNDYITSGTTGSSVTVDAGKSKHFWMKMPAPPPEISEIGIFLNEVEPLDGITIVDR